MAKTTYKLPQVRIRMVKEGSFLKSARPFNNPEVVGEALCGLLADFDREVMIAVSLNNELVPVNFSVVGVGTLNKCMFSVSNLFKTAILSNARNIIIAHNHPSGNCFPSEEDVEATYQAVQAGQILDIRVLDHIICAGDNFVSMKALVREGYVPDVFKVKESKQNHSQRQADKGHKEERERPRSRPRQKM